VRPDRQHGKLQEYRGQKLSRRKRDDRIKLAGIKLFPRLGVTAEERSRPQLCEADLTIEDNFEGAAAQDSLDSSIDYSAVLSAVQETARTGEFSLLETLAYRIVRLVLQEFPVKRAGIRIRKRPAGLMDQMDYVEVEVEES
jgi:dihydroneopterin aldolase